MSVLLPSRTPGREALLCLPYGCAQFGLEEKKLGLWVAWKFNKQINTFLRMFNCIADSQLLYTAKASGVAGRAAACSAGSVFSPLLCSDPDTEDDSVFVGGPPGSPSQLRGTGHRLPLASPRRGSAASWGRPGSSLPQEGVVQSQRQKSREPESSDEEVDSLVVRMKQRMFFPKVKRAGNQQSPRGKRQALSWAYASVGLG